MTRNQTEPNPNNEGSFQFLELFLCQQTQNLHPAKIIMVPSTPEVSTEDKFDVYVLIIRLMFYNSGMSTDGRCQKRQIMPDTYCTGREAVFLADRTIGHAFGTMCRLSSVCDVLYCGETVRPSEKVSEGVNRKPGSKSSFFGSPPYFYFRFCRYGH